jgi:hypothetical protein
MNNLEKKKEIYTLGAQEKWDNLDIPVILFIKCQKIVKDILSNLILLK